MRNSGSLFLCSLFLVGCTTRPSEDSNNTGHLFTDVTEQAGLSGVLHTNGGFGDSWAPEIVGAGGAFFDYDGDDQQDILVVTGGAFEGEPPLGAHPALRLFRNLGNGTFDEVTQLAGLALLRGYSLGVTIGDYDNDGDQDVYVTTLGPDLLLRNTDGVFEDVGQEAGVGLISEWSTSAMFFDANLDGHLDI